MATTVARLQAVLSADTRDFDRAMGHSDSRMKSVAKTAGKAGLAGAVIGLGAAVKIGFSEFMEAQRVTAQTNAVLKSTGGVANVSAKEISRLSEALMRKSGVDDETIQSGQNMLLTFTKIRNEVGQGNDIFNQATKATLDLSVAMGKDMQSSAILVGKALNDPIKGVTALTRAGVQLTESQKETIKAMVESGNTMGAQKIILKELETQFGGSAEAAGKTFAGQINIAKQTVSNFLGDMVGKAIPTLIRFKDTIVENWPAIRNAFATVFEWVRDNIFPIINRLKDIFVASVQRIREVLAENGPELERIFDRLGAAIKAIAQIALPILRVAFVEVLPRVLNAAIEILDKTSAAIEGIIKGIKWIGEHAGDVFKTFGNIAEKQLEPIIKWFDRLSDLIRAIGRGIERLIDLIGKIPDPRDLPFVPGGGDVRDPRMVAPPGAGTGPTDISSKLWDELAGARSFGLALTSGYRPGAITRSGHPSDHSIYPSHAIDVAGPASSMAAFFRWLIGQRDVKQAFYDPLGSIFGGVLSSYREGGHSDHVHVATYDKGGWLKPGLTLAMNNTGRPEPVGGNITIPVSIGGEHVATVVFDMLRRKAQVFERQNGRPAFGGA